MNKPSWLKDAIAKDDGYYNAKGERLVSRKLSAEHIAEWNSEIVTVAAEPVSLTIEINDGVEISTAEEVLIDPEVSVTVEDELKPLEKMTKAQLIEYAAGMNIEINPKSLKEEIYNTIVSNL